MCFRLHNIFATQIFFLILLIWHCLATRIVALPPRFVVYFRIEIEIFASHERGCFTTRSVAFYCLEPAAISLPGVWLFTTQKRSPISLTGYVFATLKYGNFTSTTAAQD